MEGDNKQQWSLRILKDGSHNKNDCSFWFACRASSFCLSSEQSPQFGRASSFFQNFFLKLVREKFLACRACNLPKCSLVQNITNLNKTARSSAQNCSFARWAMSEQSFSDPFNIFIKSILKFKKIRLNQKIFNFFQQIHPTSHTFAHTRPMFFDENGGTSPSKKYPFMWVILRGTSVNLARR